MRHDDRLTNLERYAGEVARGQAGQIVRHGRSGTGSGDHFQIVRGATTAAVSPADPAFQIETILTYEEHSSAPDEPLWVTAPAGGVTLAEGDLVWAIYHANSLTFDPGGGDVVVDWLMLDFGASSAPPPLRAFELTANKTLASATATAKWLDLDGNLIGSNVTLQDPEHRFSGRIADDLYSGQPGMRGYAVQRTDLAAEDPDQWDIIEMDSVREFVKAEIVKVSNYPSAGSTTIARYLVAIESLGYDRIGPAAVNSQIGYLADADIFDDSSIAEPAAEADAESAPVKVLMQLVDPDADPPEYRVYESKPLAVHEVAIIAAISASAWNSTTGKKTPTAVTSPVFYSHPDGDGTDTIDDATTIDYTSNLGVAVAAPATGKFKRGIVIVGKLVQVQCEEEDLPTGWGA